MARCLECSLVSLFGVGGLEKIFQFKTMKRKLSCIVYFKIMYIYIYIYIYYHICGKLEVAFKAPPSSQHQHCTDEAQKAETLLSAVSYIYICIYIYIYIYIKYISYIYSSYIYIY